MPSGTIGFPDQVSVTFRLSNAAHQALIAECGHCGCSVSAVVRVAVMKEIQHRRAQRKHDADVGVLAGQLEMADCQDA